MDVEGIGSSRISR